MNLLGWFGVDTQMSKLVLLEQSQLVIGVIIILVLTFLFKLRGALTNGVIKKHNRYHFKSEISSALDDYKTMGVE
jgi:purine-cytosine permease-like protein